MAKTSFSTVAHLVVLASSLAQGLGGGLDANWSLLITVCVIGCMSGVDKCHDVLQAWNVYNVVQAGTITQDIGGFVSVCALYGFARGTLGMNIPDWELF